MSKTYEKGHLQLYILFIGMKYTCNLFRSSFVLSLVSWIEEAARTQSAQCRKHIQNQRSEREGEQRQPPDLQLEEEISINQKGKASSGSRPDPLDENNKDKCKKKRTRRPT